MNYFNTINDALSNAKNKTKVSIFLQKSWSNQETLILHKPVVEIEIEGAPGGLLNLINSNASFKLNNEHSAYEVDKIAAINGIKYDLRQKIRAVLRGSSFKRSDREKYNEFFTTHINDLNEYIFNVATAIYLSDIKLKEKEEKRNIRALIKLIKEKHDKNKESSF
jgi:hypothetical protein